MRNQTEQSKFDSLTLAYYKKLALFLGYPIPLFLLNSIINFTLSGLGRTDLMFLVQGLFGISWVAFALIMLFWPFVKVNALIVSVIDRNAEKAAIGKQIAFTQLFAIAALILGIASCVALFGSATWNLAPVLGSIAIICQVLSLKHVPLFSKLISQNDSNALEV